MLERGKDVAQPVEEIGPAVIGRGLKGHEVHSEGHLPARLHLPIGEAPDEILTHIGSSITGDFDTVGPALG